VLAGVALQAGARRMVLGDRPYVVVVVPHDADAHPLQAPRELLHRPVAGAAELHDVALQQYVRIGRHHPLLDVHAVAAMGERLHRHEAAIDRADHPLEDHGGDPHPCEHAEAVRPRATASGDIAIFAFAAIEVRRSVAECGRADVRRASHFSSSSQRVGTSGSLIRP
jgi:hypothetical protein